MTQQVQRIRTIRRSVILGAAAFAGLALAAATAQAKTPAQIQRDVQVHLQRAQAYQQLSKGINEAGQQAAENLRRQWAEERAETERKEFKQAVLEEWREHLRALREGDDN